MDVDSYTDTDRREAIDDDRLMDVDTGGYSDIRVLLCIQHA